MKVSNAKLNLSRSTIIERENIYKKILRDKKIKKINNCSFEEKIIYIDEIKKLMEIYITENLKFTDLKIINKSNNLLYENEKKILKIPNISQNGAIYPKNEIQLIYNLIVYFVIKSIGPILKYIELINYPTIRFKSSSKKNKKNNPFETEKLHSDAWSGMTSDAVISMPIMGDIVNNNVIFYEPDKIDKKFFSKQKNYDIGRSLYNKKKKIYKLKKNMWYLFDHSILHQTKINKDSKPRISIDMLIKIKKNKKSNKIKHYHPVSSYEEIGSKKLLHSMENFTELSLRKKNKSISQKFMDI